MNKFNHRSRRASTNFQVFRAEIRDPRDWREIVRCAAPDNGPPTGVIIQRSVRLSRPAPGAHSHIGHLSRNRAHACAICWSKSWWWASG
jgi:hypothetical protein